MISGVVAPDLLLGVQPDVPPTMMSVDASATRRAERDRAQLASLIRRGLVQRDAKVGANVRGAAAFRSEIEDIVRPTRPPVNLAIRPRKKRRR